jgi:isopentenyl-diphosphate delta-isomerase
MPRRIPPRATSSRKKQHVDLTLTRSVGFRAKTTGLEELDFVHNALPELNLAEVDPSVRFLGHTVSLPIMVSCMTGGYREALRINREIAEVCADLRIAMGVGSQRQALESTEFHRTFSVVRDVAPAIPVIGNIGAAELARMTGADQARRLVELVRADALAVHLNPLQEFLQPEGNPNFRGVLAGIAMLVRELPVPVIAKEIGAGISHDVALRLLEAGVRYIDVAGAGGTSWAGVELLRRRAGDRTMSFWDWGIPTAEALRQTVRLREKVPELTIIASGGIGSGMDIAKCIALGADIVAAARPMLQALERGKQNALRALIASWGDELRGAMFLTGSRTLPDLRRTTLTSRAQR